MNLTDLNKIIKAIHLAEEEIYHPGSSKTNGYDVLDLISEAIIILNKEIDKRTK